jgi:hypothetical protein
MGEVEQLEWSEGLSNSSADILVDGLWLGRVEVISCAPANPQLFHADLLLSLCTPHGEVGDRDWSKEVAKEFAQALFDQRPRAVEALRTLREEIIAFHEQTFGPPANRPRR